MSSETAVADFKTPVKTVADAVLNGLRELPPDKQVEVVDFVEFLKLKARGRQPQEPRLKGMCADLGVHITEEDIAEARREMWGNFPREDII